MFRTGLRGVGGSFSLMHVDGDLWGGIFSVLSFLFANRKFITTIELFILLSCYLVYFFFFLRLFNFEGGEGGGFCHEFIGNGTSICQGFFFSRIPWRVNHTYGSYGTRPGEGLNVQGSG